MRYCILQKSIHINELMLICFSIEIKTIVNSLVSMTDEYTK